MIMFSSSLNICHEMFSSSLNISQTPASLSCDAVGNHSPTGVQYVLKWEWVSVPLINKEKCNNTKIS